MSIVLVTGSCGLVGSEASTFFSEKGFDIIGIDNNSRKLFFGKDGDVSWVRRKLEKNIKNYKHYNIDIADPNAVKKIFKKYKKNIKLVIHSAAQPSHDWAKNNIFKDFDVNARGTINLLEMTKNYCFDAPFIFMSTNKVYGDNPNKLPLVEKSTRWEIKNNHSFKNGITENMSIDNCVHSFFGASKSYADLAVQEYGKNIGLKTVCFRAGCITGPNHSGARLHGFLSYLVKTALDKKKYYIFGYKGKQVRDNIHSYDVVNCFWHFFKKPRIGQIYNMGGGRKSNCSIIEAINTIYKLTGISIKKDLKKQNRVGDHIWYVSNMKKFKNHYPKWKQIYNSEKIIDELLSSR